MTPDLSPAILMLWSRFAALTPEKRGDAPEIVLVGWYRDDCGGGDGSWATSTEYGPRHTLSKNTLDAALYRLMRLVAWGAKKYRYGALPWLDMTPADWIAEAGEVIGRLEK